MALIFAGHQQNRDFLYKDKNLKKKVENFHKLINELKEDFNPIQILIMEVVEE